MDSKRRTGIVYSALLHLFFLLVGIFGLPILISSPPPEDVVITVELLPITGITNVKPADAPPAPEDKPEPPKEQAKPAPPVKTEKSEPVPAPPKPAEKPKDKPEEKKPEVKPQDKKIKPVEEDLDAILKAVKDTAQQQKDKKDDKTEGGSKSKAISNKYDPSQPMSLSEMDAIMGQIAKCWNVPAGAKNAQDLVIVVYAEFNQDGSYTKVELAQDQRRYSSDTFFRAAADAAIRAVKQCSPLTGLPADKYQKWHALELHFDPKFMLN